MADSRKLLIFGAGEYADVAHHYFTRDGARAVAAFVVDDEYLDRAETRAAPLVAWSEARTRFPPLQNDIFVAIGYSGLNHVRTRKAADVATAGYRLASFLHSKSVVWDGFELRPNCFILEHNTIQPFASVGANVVMWSGNHLGHHSVVEEGCFITSHVVIAGAVCVGAESFVGINATIRDHVTIGKRNVIGAGAVILGDTPDEAVFISEKTAMSKVPSTRLHRI